MEAHILAQVEAGTFSEQIGTIEAFRILHTETDSLSEMKAGCRCGGAAWLTFQIVICATGACPFLQVVEAWIFFQTGAFRSNTECIVTACAEIQASSGSRLHASHLIRGRSGLLFNAGNTCLLPMSRHMKVIHLMRMRLQADLAILSWTVRQDKMLGWSHAKMKCIFLTGGRRPNNFCERRLCSFGVGMIPCVDKEWNPGAVPVPTMVIEWVLNLGTRIYLCS